MTKLRLMSREPREPYQPDLDPYLPLIEEGLKAFGSNPLYAELMAKNAVTTERKRGMHAIRREVKAAETEARTVCEEEDFVCPVTNPCGTGDCRFANKELAVIDLVSAGKTIRPSNSIRDSYSIEDVVKVLYEQRRKK